MSKQKYRCLLLVRVSSVGQHDGEGVDLQIDRGLLFAQQRYQIERQHVHIVVETFSGRKEDRPYLEEVFATVRKEGIKLVLFYDIDRLTRAGPSFYQVTKKRFAELGCDIADVKGIIQPSTNLLAGSGGTFGDDFEYDWSHHTPSEKAEVMEAQMAKDEACKILSRTIPVVIKNAQSGLTTRLAPFGYKNCKIIGDNGQPQASKAINEDEAYFVRKIFDLKARGNSSVVIAEAINALGYKSRTKRKWSSDRTKVIGQTGGNPISPKEVFKIIRRVDYAGFNLDRWTYGHPVEANHPALIDLKLWNQANAGDKQIERASQSPTGWDLVSKAEPQNRCYRRHRDEFAFKRMIMCNGCHRRVTASFSRGKLGKRYGYYHCSKSNCGQRVSTKKTHDAIEQTLVALKFGPDAAERFEQHIRALWISKVGGANARLASLSNEIAELRTQADNVMEKLKLVQSTMIIERLENDFEEIMTRVKLLEAQRTKKEISEGEINKVLAFARYLIEHLDDLVMNAPDEGTRALFWDLIFTETPTLENLKNRTLAISPLVRLKEDFEIEKGTMAALRGVSSNFSKPLAGQPPSKNGDGLATESNTWNELNRWLKLCPLIERSLDIFDPKNSAVFQPKGIPTPLI